LFLSPVLFAQVLEANYGVVLLKCANQQLYFAGINQYGQAGDGTLNSTSTLAPIPGKDSTLAFSSGQGFILWVKTDGTLYAWGKNLNGNLGIGQYWDTLIPAEVPNINDAFMVASGNSHSLVLTGDSTVYSSGSNNYGELGRPLDSIARNLFGPVEILKEVVSVHAGSVHSAALDKNGHLWLWGQGAWGQLGLGNRTNRTRPQKLEGFKFSKVYLSHLYTLGIDSAGSVWVWGENQQGELGVPVASNGSPYIISPQKVPGITNVVQVASSFGTTLALLSDGRVKAWGNNDYFQLANGTTQDRFSPDYIGGLNAIHSVAVNGAVCYALDSNGTLYTWGFGYEWLLHGNDSLKTVPTPVNFTACTPAINMVEYLEPKWEVYPNVIDDYLMISSDQIIEEVSILNTTGNTVYKTYPHQNTFQISIPYLESGLFFLKTRFSDNKVRVRKIMRR
jgi:alpha-tubulin suppressor-like RCC1 family protein